MLRNAARGGYAYSLKDKTFAYELLIDTDAFLFETLSTFEITRRFVAQFFSHMFGLTAYARNRYERTHEARRMSAGSRC